MKSLQTIIIILCTVLLISGCNSLEPSKQFNTGSVEKEEEKQSLVALYHGIPLNSNDQKINIFNQGNIEKQQIYKKYEKEYHLYANNKLVQKANGKIEERGLDYYWQVNFPAEVEYEVALTQSYNPYPRKTDNITSRHPKEFSSAGQVIDSIDDQFDVNVETTQLTSIDLDGDGKKEFLALVVDEENNFFAKVLVDFNYKVISYLTVVKEEHANLGQLIKDYDLFNSGEIIDIDNDGNMEILMVLPSYEGFSFKFFEYENGTFNGERINYATLKP